MKENNDMSDLEKITYRAEELIVCPVENCEFRGDYWKCYMGNYRKCSIYLHDKVYKDRKSK